MYCNRVKTVATNGSLIISQGTKDITRPCLTCHPVTNLHVIRTLQNVISEMSEIFDGVDFFFNRDQKEQVKLNCLEPFKVI